MCYIKTIGGNMSIYNSDYYEGTYEEGLVDGKNMVITEIEHIIDYSTDDSDYEKIIEEIYGKLRKLKG